MKGLFIAVAGMVFAALSVGALFWVTAQEVSATDWSALSPEEAYARTCLSCHGPDGTAPNGTANTLKGKRRYWDVDRLVEYMTDPRGYNERQGDQRLGARYMQPIAASVPAETRRRIAQFVYDELMD